MSPLLVFMTELTLSMGFSLIVIALLRPLLRNVLIETCGNSTRAEFWVMYTQLMLVAAPLIPVVFLSATGDTVTPAPLIVIKDSLFRMLLGMFVALAMIGRIIWKTIDNDTPTSVVAGESNTSDTSETQS